MFKTASVVPADLLLMVGTMWRIFIFGSCRYVIHANEIKHLYEVRADIEKPLFRMFTTNI